ncbi:MAG: hypothetical protein M1830_009429 [Pleopsidium flavum]|nr:MAG: hypothetical protein M1830_009429 [Pleopsidium flavum]
MDPQLAVASRDDIWRMQTDMKTVQATQIEHADRLLRLERRQDDDARMKSVWGNSSPFPSILSGTPQQDQGYNPAAEAFKNFDQDQQNNLIGSLHLDNDDEPRRGASRANSVRFDESALHGHFAQGSRSSSDFFPLRTGSGLGSHPMVERSSSHKSDGRQSSAGQSTHSARTNSLGLETSNLLGRAGITTDMPLGPPPGLFILGAVPSIIRCWLDTNFSNETLHYAAVCTGSYKSYLNPYSVSRLGLEQQVNTDENGTERIKMPVYLPEATVQRMTSSRSNSPTPQLPALTIDFIVQDVQPEGKAIQVLLGSDVLRAHNADILFSQDRLTLFDDTRNKLSIPLVRPEDATLYNKLITCAQIPEIGGVIRNGERRQHTAGLPSNESAFVNGGPSSTTGLDLITHSVSSPAITASSETSVIGDRRKSAGSREPGDDASALSRDDRSEPSNGPGNTSITGTPTRTESGNIWGSWRRDSTQNFRPDMATSSNTTTGSGYQRAGRGRGMKVLKPAKSGTTSSSRSFSATQPATGFDAAPPRFADAGRRGSQTAKSDDKDDQPVAPRISFSGEAKALAGPRELQSVTNKPRSTNPIGGASAFGWLNSNQQKRSTAAAE